MLEFNPDPNLPGDELPLRFPAGDECFLELLMINKCQLFIPGGIQNKRQGQLGGTATGVAPLEAIRRVIIELLAGTRRLYEKRGLRFIQSLLLT